MAESGAPEPGLVVASHGRHCIVETPDGRRVLCHPRGKRSEAVVGDRVGWQASGDGGTIEHIEPRRNLLWRQDEWRSKRFAANLDLILLLVAAEPEFSEQQLARALIAAEAQGISTMIALNKSDLVESFERAWARLLPYQHMGHGVMPLSLLHSAVVDRDKLLERLRGRTTLVLGPSGAGKSTLVNLLAPGAAAATGEISRALGSGRHTTTTTTWYWADESRETAIVDSPGFQAFGLHHIQPADLAGLMPDLRAHLGGCRFYNCTHRHEPGCAVVAAVKSADDPHGISPGRYKIYSDLFDELSRSPH